MGIQTTDDLVLFIEMSHYDIAFKNQKETESITLGLALKRIKSESCGEILKTGYLYFKKYRNAGFF
ncbi:hypothetical protein [Flavobacterium tiangeerense]|uniref:hypothetical protein n=1 Tax=Flavobacterium tiangeerense TaxID=459471 RepID=UPI0011A7D95C|nr:hypothetical protein [Flavobacterium tiangeerense]